MAFVPPLMILLQIERHDPKTHCQLRQSVPQVQPIGPRRAICFIERNHRYVRLDFWLADAKHAARTATPRQKGGRTTEGRIIMSSVSIDTGADLAAASARPTEISRRLESLPASAYLWRLVVLLSLGGCFEIYDLFLTGYIAPGLGRSKLLTATTDAFFGFSGIGAFVAATFAGLFIGTFFLGFLADRFGRRSIFTWALLAYSAASVVMACQTTPAGLLLWRLIAGIGIGVEIITIDAYITELVPSWMRG